MRIVALISLLGVILAAESKEWIFESNLQAYLRCMSTYSPASVVESTEDTFVTGEREVFKFDLSTFSDKESKSIIVNKTDNRKDGVQPMVLQTSVFSSATNLNQAVTGHNVGANVDAGGKIGKVGVSVEATFEHGGSTNMSHISKSQSQQSWSRKFNLPPRMTVSSSLKEYDRTIDTPVVVEQFAKGYIEIQFESFKDSKYKEHWQGCGKSEPKIVAGSNPVKLRVRVDNLVPLSGAEAWEVNSDGSVSKMLRAKDTEKTTRKVVRHEMHTAFLDKNMKLENYCNLINPDLELDAITQTKREEGDITKTVEGHNSVVGFNFKGEYEGDDDDDDDDDKKKKKPKKH